MRLTGLASGLDVDSMVTELMKARRTVYDNMVKKRTKEEWKQEDYRSMSSKIVDFRNNKLSAYKMSSAISAKTSEVGGDTSALTVNSTASTASGSLTVKVTSVATAASSVYKFTGGTTVSTDNGDGTSTVTEKSLSDLGFAEDGSTGNVVVTINDKAITLSKTATLKDLASAINSNSSTTKATAIYNSTTGQFSISGNKTGADSLEVENFATSGVTVDPVSVGADAEISINGITYTQSSNRFSNSGFDFTIKAESAASSSTTITAMQDTTKIVETIKSFVTEYNSLISSINSELSETKNRSYDPLTSDEKEEMSDDEIELWETKARSGTLRNDGTLSQLISELRSAATALVGGITDADGNKISIGITTGSYTEKGKLVLDEDKLRSALETNADDVTSLFSDSSTGVFTKMTNSSMTALKTLSTKAGTSLTSTDTTASFLETSLLSTQIKGMKTREQLMLDRLEMLETQYYKQFTAMETAINKFNSQSSSLTSLTSS